MNVNTFRANWKGLWMTAFHKRYSVITIILGILFFVALLLSVPYTEQKTLAELSVLEMSSVAMLSIDVLSIMLIIFTALVIAGNFSRGTIHSILLITPQRKKMMIGKLVVQAVYALFMTVIMLSCLFIALIVFITATGKPLLELTHVPVVKLVLGSSVMPIFYTILASAFSFMFQSVGGALTAGLIVMFLPAVANLLSDAAGATYLSFMPSSAIHTLSGTATLNEKMSTITAIILLFVWMILSSVVGYWRFRKKDL